MNMLRTLLAWKAAARFQAQNKQKITYSNTPIIDIRNNKKTNKIREYNDYYTYTDQNNEQKRLSFNKHKIIHSNTNTGNFRRMILKYRDRNRNITKQYRQYYKVKKCSDELNICIKNQKLMHNNTCSREK